MEIVTSIQVCLNRQMNYYYKENGGKWSVSCNSKAFVHPNEENIIVVPIRKRMEIITSIQVWLISQINIDYKENGGEKKLPLQIQSINIVYPNVENMIAVPITRRM